MLATADTVKPSQHRADSSFVRACQSFLGTDLWRASHISIPMTKLCPNECLGRGSCAYGFCHCEKGRWGLDCGMTIARAQHLRREGGRPRIFMYETPVTLRRSCGPWRLPEELSDVVLKSTFLEPDPAYADLFWIYGCPNGDTIMPSLRWIKMTHPHWNASVRAAAPRHVLVVGHEEGWGEVWSLLGRCGDEKRSLFSACVQGDWTDRTRFFTSDPFSCVELGDFVACVHQVDDRTLSGSFKWRRCLERPSSCEPHPANHLPTTFRQLRLHGDRRSQTWCDVRRAMPHLLPTRERCDDSGFPWDHGLPRRYTEAFTLWHGQLSQVRVHAHQRRTGIPT